MVAFKVMRFFLFIIILSAGLSARAQFQHERIRRITVFPLKVNNEMRDTAETVWWDAREHLTETRRFLIASKNFMQAKDVFQARGELNPADALILGRLLDADALVTTFVVERRLGMRVYETKNGFTLWSGDIDLHPAVPVSKQLPDAVKKLLYDFISSVPYQGFVIVDSLLGRPSYTEGDNLFFKADIGVGTQITVGDTTQLVSVRTDKLKPLFQGGATIDVYVEGKIISVDRQIITVQVTRKQQDYEIKANALVRVPDELRRFKEIYGMQESSDKNIGLESINNESDQLTAKEKEYKPLIVSLSWIGSFALLLLLAF
ncbi:MAG: hypothetical protein A2Z20_09560 [Bdellovibrionales bacterium RBG_16_40_8]|nr:MAG: hypothetical protein A2Z20_09560 [Bdellovibrionales bacterium RBG_16_40_8]